MLLGEVWVKESILINKTIHTYSMLKKKTVCLWYYHFMGERTIRRKHLKKFGAGRTTTIKKKRLRRSKQAIYVEAFRATPTH